MGPDGCGKSLVLNAVSGEFAPVVPHCELLPLRPQAGGPQANKPGAGHGSARAAAPRHRCFGCQSHRSVAGLHAWIPGADLARRSSAPNWSSSIAASTICWWIASASATAGRHGCCTAAARLSPGLDLVVLLDAPPEVLRSRKQEVPLEEVARQRAAYLELARTLPTAVVVNAAQPAEDVIQDALTVILDHWARRAGSGLDSRCSRDARSGEFHRAKPAMVSPPDPSGPLTFPRYFNSAFPTVRGDSPGSASNGLGDSAGHRAALGRDRRCGSRSRSAAELAALQDQHPFAVERVDGGVVNCRSTCACAGCNHSSQSGHRLHLLAASSGGV